MKPNDIVGVNKDSHLILESLPADYDTRAKAMAIKEKPLCGFEDVGGLDKQI